MKNIHRRRGLIACIACVAGVSALLACSEDESFLPSDTPTGADAGVDGSPPTNADASDAGAEPDASADAAPGPCEDVVPAGPKPTAPALCNASAWTVVSEVQFPKDNLDVLRSITPDELTMAWASTGTHSTKVKVGDRATRDGAFEHVREVEGFGEGSLLGLSPDGLRLCGNDLSGKAFSEATRASRSDDFGAPTEGSFALLNADTEAKSGRLLACVISADDRTLYYNLLDPAHPEVALHVSRRTDASPWPVGSPVASCALRASSDDPSYYPTGIASDDRTIFYQSALVPVPRMATRAGADWPFSEVVDLPEKGTVIPNQDCGRVYFNKTQDGVSSIFLASSP